MSEIAGPELVLLIGSSHGEAVWAGWIQGAGLPGAVGAQVLGASGWGASVEGRDASGMPRDGVKGRLQIVYGLLCSPAGIPIAIEVFEGNSADPKTLAAMGGARTLREGPISTGTGQGAAMSSFACLASGVLRNWTAIPPERDLFMPEHRRRFSTQFKAEAALLHPIGRRERSAL